MFFDFFSSTFFVKSNAFLENYMQIFLADLSIYADALLGYEFLIFFGVILASLMMVYLFHVFLDKKHSLDKNLLRKTKIPDKPIFDIFEKPYEQGIFSSDKGLRLNKYADEDYFYKPRKLAFEKKQELLDTYLAQLELTDTDLSYDYLVYNLRKLFSKTAYFNLDDMVIKQRLFDLGWSFDEVNNAFQEIRNHAEELIRNSFLIYPNSDIYTIVRKVRSLSTKGFTMEQIYESLGNIGYSQGYIKKIDKKIIALQEIYNNKLALSNRNISLSLSRNIRTA